MVLLLFFFPFSGKKRGRRRRQKVGDSVTERGGREVKCTQMSTKICKIVTIFYALTEKYKHIHYVCTIYYVFIMLTVDHIEKYDQSYLE